MDFDILKKLCLADGVSSDEDRVRNMIISEIKDHADELSTDAAGNLIVFKRGAQRPVHKLLLSAHMDEVGFIVTFVNPDGTLRVDEVGGIDRRVILGKQVHLSGAGLDGVFSAKPTHLLDSKGKSAIPELSDMYIDIGALDRADAESHGVVGDIVSFKSTYEENKQAVIAKALDDRAGCTVLIDMIKSELPYDMYFTFVVQEEVGLRGATTAAYTVDPEFAIVVETTTAADIPNVEESRHVCTLGNGAVISFMDRHTLYDRELYRAAFAAAESAGVKAQAKQAVAGGNDSGVISTTRGGVRTIAVSLPCRYLHSPNTVAFKEDMNAVEETVRVLAERISGGTLGA